jgi:hypothetical protein
VKKLHNIVNKIFHPQQTPTGPENMQTKPVEGCTDHSANSAKEPISSTVADLGNKVKANKKTCSFIDTTPLGPKGHMASINKSKPEGSENIRATRPSKGNRKRKTKDNEVEHTVLQIPAGTKFYRIRKQTLATTHEQPQTADKIHEKECKP